MWLYSQASDDICWLFRLSRLLILMLLDSFILMTMTDHLLTISWPLESVFYVEYDEWPEAESEVWCHNASVNIFCWPEEGQGTVTTLFTDHNVSVVVSGGHLPVQPGLTVINMPTALTSTAILCSCVLVLDMDRCVAVIDYIREYQEKNLHIRKFVKFKIKC